MDRKVEYRVHVSIHQEYDYGFDDLITTDEIAARHRIAELRLRLARGKRYSFFTSMDGVELYTRPVTPAQRWFKEE